MENENELKDVLTALGMGRAFVDPALPNGAEFEGISVGNSGAKKLYLERAIHKAFVEVNEKGTEAAAATAAITVTSTVRADPFTPTFRADKPFIFAIRDVKSSTILFLGRLMNPQ